MTNLGVLVCQELAAAGYYTSPSHPLLGPLGQDWFALTGLALLVSLFLLILIYLFASFTRNQQLFAWTKFELFQILATVSLLAFALVWIAGMCSFDMTILNDKASGIDYSNPLADKTNPNYDPNSPKFKNMFDIVEDYFGTLETLGMLMFGQIMYISKWIVLLQKVTYFSSPLGLGTTDNPTDSIGQLNNVIFIIVSGFATSYLIIGVQGKIIEYMAYAALYYLLPFGVFFRAFEPTRGFGGTLMGLAFSFFLFYPIIIVANDYLMKPSANQIINELKAWLKGAEDKTKDQDINKFSEKAAEEGKKLRNGGLDPQDVVGSVTSGTLFLLKPSAFYFVAGVVLPVLNFIVLIEITRSLTGFMGEPVDVSNLTRMI